MGRKKKDFLEELFDLTAAAPPWLGIALALMSFLIFHWLAGTQPDIRSDASRSASILMNAIVRGLAWGCQFLFPVLFLLASAVSTFKRLSRPKYLASGPDSRPPRPTYDGSGSKEPDLDQTLGSGGGGELPLSAIDTTSWNLGLLRALEWKRFEQLCAGYFETLGFRARTTRMGADGGVDIHLSPDGSDDVAIVVQCKAWKVYKVGIKPIRELLGVMTSERVPEGVFVTTGDYTLEARDFASKSNIILIDGTDLLAKLKSLHLEKQGALLGLAIAGDFTTPTCPSCGVKMSERKSKSGGDPFWGCVNFPRCRTTLKMSKDSVP